MIHSATRGERICKGRESALRPSAESRKREEFARRRALGSSTPSAQEKGGQNRSVRVCFFLFRWRLAGSLRAAQRARLLPFRPGANPLARASFCTPEFLARQCSPLRPEAQAHSFANARALTQASMPAAGQLLGPALRWPLRPAAHRKFYKLTRSEFPPSGAEAAKARQDEACCCCGRPAV